VFGEPAGGSNVLPGFARRRLDRCFSSGAKEPTITTVDVASYPTLEGFDPLSQEFARDPLQLLARARRECPVFYYPPLGVWFVTRYDDVERILVDFETYSSRTIGSVAPPPELAGEMPKNLMEHAFISLDPPEHTVARKRANTWFTRGRMHAMEPGIRACANELIDAFVDVGYCELMHQYCYALTVRTIVRLLGMPTEDIPRFAQWAEDMFVLMAPAAQAGNEGVQTRPIDEAERSARWQRIAEARRYYAAVAGDRRMKPREDLISEMVLARGEDGEPLISNEQIITHIMELIAAGTDTTATLMGHMVCFFGETPQQIADVRGDPTLMRNAVEEGLRRRGSSPLNFRVTTKDVELRGIAIPAGSVLAVMFASAGHDEDHFPDAGTFDIRRANAGEHLSLGKGRHLCMGAPLARMSARVGLQTLYERIPSIRVVPGQVLEYEPTYTTLMLKRLEVEWENSPHTP
jgi:cytochrome P450